MKLWDELKRRNVIRMAGLYLVGSWLVLQVAETLLPIYDTPDWVLKALVLLIALGFIPAMVFSWVFELTPDGLQRDAQVAEDQSRGGYSARRMDRMIGVGLLALVIFFVVDRMWLSADQDAMRPQASAPRANADQSPPPTEDLASVIPSVAVLPFSNLSGDPEQEYFSDGMTEELLNVLAKIKGLKVAARTSVFAFKDQGGDVRQIGSTLGVSHIVEGSVRRDGNHIRVTAQLIRVADGFHEWSHSYDRQLESVFALQDDIANRVSLALKESLGVAASAKARSDIAPEAYDHYLKGRSLLRSRSDLNAAIDHFEAAVELEPDFAAGWYSLSLAYEVKYWYVEHMTLAQLEEVFRNVTMAAKRAEAIEPDSPGVQHALGNAARSQFQYAEAERHYLRSMQLDPSYPDAREDYTELLLQVGRPEASMAAARQLVELDPYFVVGWQRYYSAALQLGQFADAQEAVERVRAFAPYYLLSKVGLMNYAIAHNRQQDAQEHLAWSAERWPEDMAYAQVMLPWAFGDDSISEQALQQALQITPNGEKASFMAARGDISRYNAEMHQAGPNMQVYYYSNLFDNIGAGHAMMRDPRVKELLIRYGFVAYWRELGWPAICRPLGDDDFECGLALERAR
ncbi:MAG: hypothetical protein DHS20C11_08530 [Lysobacteraceae bacterium]|nr:MAG: hypothetical protein DHS20C11_08530 [Xanthomonadaceae bacterium]